MPWIASIIIGGLIQLAGTLVGRVLLALGFGFVEFAGISTLIDSIKQAVTNGLENFASGATAVMLQWAGFLRFDVHITILLSAIGVKALLSALTGQTVRRLVQK